MQNVNAISNFEIFSFIYKTAIKPFKLRIAIIIFTCIYWAADLNARSYIVKLVGDQLPFITRSDAFNTLFPYLMLYVGATAFRFFIFRLYDYAWLKMKPDIQQAITETLFDHVCYKSDVFLQKNISGNYTNQLQELSMKIPELVNLVMNNFVCHFFALLISLYSFSRISHNFMILLAVLIVVFVSLSIYLCIKGSKLSTIATGSKMVLLGQMGDSFSNIFSVRIFNAENSEARRILGYFLEFRKDSIRRDIFALIIHALQSIAFLTYHSACFILLVYEYQRGSVTNGGFMFIFAINRDIAECLWMLSSDISTFAEKLGDITCLLKELLQGHEVDQSGKELALSGNFDIEFKDICFTYPASNRSLFKNFCLKIEHGQKIGVIGYSGSGKSSLVNLITKLCKPDSGQIMIAGQDIANYSPAEVRKYISVIMQDLSLFNRSVLDNIRYGKQDASFQEVVEAAKKANIHEVIQNLDNQYESIIDLKGGNLSFGQKQRILIARAILKDAPILIMDEATSALDISTETKVNDAIKTLVQGKTVIVIAHKLKALGLVDKLIVLSDGEVVQAGTQAELSQEEGLFKELIAHSNI